MSTAQTPDATTAGPRPVVMTLTVTVTALVHPEAVGGYSAEVPALRGVYTEGETLDEVRDNLREAAEGWLASMHDRAVGRRAAGQAP